MVGSIVIKIGKRDMMEDKKYPTAYYYSNYGVVRVKRKVDNITKVNIEWYNDDPKKEKYEDEEIRYVNIDTVCTVAQEGICMPVEYVSLQHVFFQKANGRWELNKYHDAFLVGARMVIGSCRRKRLRAYKDFVIIWRGNLGLGVRVTIPNCCVKIIRQEFPKTGEAGDREYTGFKRVGNM